MNENVENLILAQLREMRVEMKGMSSEVADLRKEMGEGFADTNQRVDGLSLILSMLAGHLHGVEERIERLETGRNGAT